MSRRQRFLETEREVYVYRLLVEFPPGSEQPGWQPDNWREVCERLGWVDEWQDEPPFSWPQRRSYLKRDAAEKRAGYLRDYGAKVEVLRSLPVVWPLTEDGDGG